MSVAAFLVELRGRDIQISAEGDQLRCTAPAGVLTPELREQLRHRKNEILVFLRAADRASRQPRAIVPLQARGARAPLFAVGGHNGDVFCYRALAQHLGDDQPFFGLQPPGVDGRDAPLTSVEELAEYFAAQIREFTPRLSCIVAGYCAGGAIAFELARQLMRQGTAIGFVALFAGRHPTWFRPLSQRRHHVLDMLARVRVHSRSLASLSNVERRSYVADRLRRILAPGAVDASDTAPDSILIARARVQEATMIGIRRYRPGYFDGRLSLFLPNRNWLRSSTGVTRWRPLASNVQAYTGPDDCPAEEMLIDPHVGRIAELFRCARDSAHAGSHNG